MQIFASSTILLLLLSSPTTAKNNLRSGSDGSERGQDRDLVDFFDDEDADTTDMAPRIVNGAEARLGRYRYFTSIYQKSWWGPPGHSCGGSLIHKDIVLCAAHCTPAADQVRVGAVTENDWYDRNRDQPFHDSEILRKIVHPRYNTNTLNYDVALYKINPVSDSELLDSMMNIGCSARADADLDSSNDSLTAMGLGRIYTNGPLAENLQEVEVKYVPNCDSYFRGWGTITNEMMCAKDPGQDSCQGDSGGPLVVKGSSMGGKDDCQVGIVSWGMNGCASGTPGVYARIAPLADWIQREICKHSDFPPSSCPGVDGDSDGGNPNPSPTPPSPTPPSPTPRPNPQPTPTPPTPEPEECCWLFWCSPLFC